MLFGLVKTSYGKTACRIRRSARHADRHDIKELNARRRLEGDFESAHSKGDNRTSCRPIR